MKLFRLIEIDLNKERQRIAKRGYNPRQRKALLKLVDLFEAGKFKDCLDHIHDPKTFPYNKAGEYSELEHIGTEIADVLQSMDVYSYYTVDDLLKEAKAKLKT